MKTIKLIIKDLQIFADGNGVIVVANPHASNPSGVYKQTAGQLHRLAVRASVPSAQLLKMLIGMPGDCTFELDITEHKAGDSWENERTGETGVYEKDGFRGNNESISLGAIAAQQLFTVAFNAASAFAPVAAAPVAAQPEEQSDDLAEEPKATKKK